MSRNFLRVALLAYVFVISCSGSNEQAVKWTGLSMDVDVTPESTAGEVRAGFSFWNIPVELSINYTDQMVAGCATVAGSAPFCVKRPVGGP